MKVTKQRILTLLATMTLITPLAAQEHRGSAADGSFFTPENLPYSVLHMREFMPTTGVERGNSARLHSFRYRLD